MLEGSGLNPEVSEYGNQYDIYGYTPFFIDGECLSGNSLV